MEEQHQLTDKDILQSAESRPWGIYRVLLETPYTKVKEIVVHPHQRLSLQYHNHRSEVWTVVKGDGSVQLGDETAKIFTEDVVQILEKEPHRIMAGDSGITFIEVQLSSDGIFSEDDIIIIDDDYGRIEE